MELELIPDSSRENKNGGERNVIEQSTQEVGTITHLPRVYSVSGKGDLFVDKRPPSRSSSISSSNRNSHPSLMNLTLNYNPIESPIVEAKIRYDSRGEVLNYTSPVISMFHLKNREDFMGESVLCLIDSAYLNEKGEVFIYDVFGLEGMKDASTSSEHSLHSEDKEANKESSHVVNAVRSNGDVFPLRVDVEKASNGTYCAKLFDMNATSQPREPETMSIGSSASSFYSSYTEFLRQRPMESSYNSSSISGNEGYVVDMHIKDENDSSIDVSRFDEDTTAMEEGGLSILDRHIFNTLRDYLEKGIILLDVQAASLDDVVTTLLNEADLKLITTSSSHEMVHQLFTSAFTPHPQSNMTDCDREGVKVYVAAIDHLPTSIIGLARLRAPLYMEDADLAICYVLLLLGGNDMQDKELLRSMGVAFSMMMSQAWFCSAARKVTSASLYLKLIDTYMARCMILPYSDSMPTFSHPQSICSDGRRCDGCFRKKKRERKTFEIPNNTAQRTEYQVRQRNRVMKERDTNLLSDALAEEPTVEELERESLSISKRFTRGDKWIIPIVSIVATLLFVLLLMGCFQSYKSDLHEMKMLDSPFSVTGGLRVIDRSQRVIYSLNNTAGLYSVRMILEQKASVYSVSYSIIGETNHSETTLYTRMIQSSTREEREENTDIDIMDISKKHSSLYLALLTNASFPVSFMLHVESYSAIGKHRVALGCILLVVVYIILVLELINRALVAFIGSFIALVLLTLVSSSPSFDEVVSWIDTSTLVLIFSMMIIVQMLSSTGVFETIAVRITIQAKSNLRLISVLLCLFTAILSSFLDNATTILLVAPITIEIAKIIHINPIPLLIPECIFANIGGASTMIGDPSNIMIGNALSGVITFNDFIVNCAPCALLCMAVVYAYTYAYYRNDYSCIHDDIHPSLVKQYPLKNRPLMWKCGIVVVAVVLCYFTYSIHHVELSSIAAIGAVMCLLLGSNRDMRTTFELLEWETLLFFTGLFILIGAINKLGVIHALGEMVTRIVYSASPRYRKLYAYMLVLWVSGITCSVLDNIAYVATMIPIIKILGENSDLGLDIKALAWCLSFGACFGGSGTLIGAGANLVGVGISKSYGYPISFSSFSKYGIVAALIALVISSIYICIFYLWSCLLGFIIMAKKGSKQVPKDKEVLTKPSTEEIRRLDEAYQPGCLSSILSSKKLDGTVIIENYDVSGDEFEVGSEEEKSWNPNENDDELEAAFEAISRNPDKWMKEMEKEMAESEGEEEGEEEEGEGEGEEEEEEEEEGEGEEEEEKEEEEEEGEGEEGEEEEGEEEEKLEPEEEEKPEPEERQETKAADRKKEGEQRLSAARSALKSIKEANAVLVKGISFQYDETSFRALFEKVGKVTSIFIVRRPNGKMVGFGAVEFDSSSSAGRALELNETMYLGRPLGVTHLDDKKVLDREGNRKEMKKMKGKKEKKERKGVGKRKH